MTHPQKIRGLLLGLGVTLALAACGGGGDSATNDANSSNLQLSTVVASVFATSNNDTATPLNINNLNIDSSSEDPNDPRYAALLGS